jgi:hypothetical protein
MEMNGEQSGPEGHLNDVAEGLCQGKNRFAFG